MWGGCAPAGPDDGTDGAADVRPVFEEVGTFAGLPDAPLATASSAFWERWGDGRAELSGYRVRIRRYGALREGTLALVYVTEPHDRRRWIKDDHAPEDRRVNVLKLLAHATFRTGIYPYTVTRTVYAPVARWREERFAPVKLVGSVDEWCGSWQAVLWPGEGRLRALRLSYFAEEGETRAERRVPSGTLYEDALLIQLRELDGPFAGGADWEGALVPSLWTLRAGHETPRPVAATISREEAERDGTPVTRFTLRHGEWTRRFDVERTEPRRLLGWRSERAGELMEEAALLGSERLAYWERNAPGDEALLARLGLGPDGG